MGLGILDIGTLCISLLMLKTGRFRVQNLLHARRKRPTDMWDLHIEADERTQVPWTIVQGLRIGVLALAKSPS